MEEEWKKVKDYEGLYEVSNLGRVKSLRFNKEKIFKRGEGKNYLYVVLSKNSIKKTISIHQLVAICFLNHNPCGSKIVVDHIDNNPSNNRVDNLQLITTRENTSKDRTNGALGVKKINNKFISKIYFNGKRIHLGTFTTAEEASLYYKNAVIAIENGTEIVSVKRIQSSKYKCIYFHKASKRWIVRFTFNKKRIYLGQFFTEEDANKSYQNKLNQIENI